LTKFTAEQKERMLEFAERFGWRIHKAGAEAVDAFCAQIGVPQRVFKNWMYRHLASAPSALCKKRSLTKLTAEQKERMLEFAERFGWRIHKADAEAVDAFCAQIGVPQRVFKN
jgi:ZF-HD class homeobox domain-containing protein